MESADAVKELGDFALKISGAVGPLVGVWLGYRLGLHGRRKDALLAAYSKWLAAMYAYRPSVFIDQIHKLAAHPNHGKLEQIEALHSTIGTQYEALQVATASALLVETDSRRAAEMTEIRKLAQLVAGMRERENVNELMKKTMELHERFQAFKKSIEGGKLL